MILKTLALHHIRSYVDETIEFPEGSILLAGDIGAGKSTILLAIEFALFGASKSELPAESLLRKGASQGSVECRFSLEGKEITIKRGLKRERDTVRQTAGHIIINDIKRELMPTELKAEVISLLGYPEDTAAKDKNYLFRYTIYTPQEEMRRILEDEPEERLNTLRRIFNIDKYTIVRENLKEYLRTLRGKIRSSEAFTEPLAETEAQQGRTEEEIRQLQESLQSMVPQLTQLQQQLLVQQKELERTEQQQQEFRQMSQEVNALMVLLQEKQRHLHGIQERFQHIRQRLSALALDPGVSLEKVQQEQREAEELRQSLLAAKVSLQEKSQYLWQQLTQAEEEIRRLTQELTALPPMKEKLRQLEKELAGKEGMQRQKTLGEKTILEIAEEMAKNEKVLQDSRQVLEQIPSLKECPTCRQEITPVHREQILMQEQEKLQNAEQSLAEQERKRKEIRRQLEQITSALETIQHQERQFLKTELEIRQLSLKEQELPQKRQEQRALQENLTALQQELQSASRESQLQALEQRLSHLREQLSRLVQQKELREQQQALQRQREETEQQYLRLQQEWEQKQQLLVGMRDVTSELPQRRTMLNELARQERSLAVQQAQVETQLAHRRQEREKSEKLLQRLRAEKQRLTRMKELHRWLEEHFTNLTHTIERQVMLAIHRLFSGLFQEWFSILIDDDSITAHIDDSFHPQIEQNGYEVSFTFLSGGEKTSAALAYRLALNRVINDIIHQIKTKDLLILDEPTDGFSSEQLDKVREVLDRLHLRQTIIVSHEAKIEAFVEKVIRVEKEGHVSRIDS